MVFGRRVNGRTLTFGVSGMLRQSNLIMWDHETESWWQQGTFEAIVGDLAGTRLDLIPATIVSWKDFLLSFPQGKVLSHGSFPGYESLSIYGTNPYDYYDTAPRPFLFAGDVDNRLPAMERVVAFTLGKRRVAVPFEVLSQRPVVTLDDGEVVVFYKPDTRSVLDSPSVVEGRRVGTAGVYRSRLDGKRLTFEGASSGRFRDKETGSLWNVFGVAVEGPLQGQRLAPLFSTQSLWFYEAAASPNIEIYSP